MKLIDADALKKALHMWEMQGLYLPHHFEDLINEQPEVDPSDAIAQRFCEANKSEHCESCKSKGKAVCMAMMIDQDTINRMYGR